MVTIKRYFGRFRKPRFWRGLGHVVRRVVLPLVVAAALLLVVRTYVATPYAVVTERSDLALQVGDRVLVLPSYRRQQPIVGDVVVYHPVAGQPSTAVGRITAIAGDTIAYPVHGRLRPHFVRVDSVMVSQRQFVGRLTVVTYSVIPGAPFYRCLRPQRFWVTP